MNNLSRLLSSVIPRVLCSDVMAGCDQLRAHIRLLHHHFYGTANIRWVPRVNQDSRTAADLRNARDVGCDDWHTQLHCLERREAKAFVDRGVEENVRIRQCPPTILHVEVRQSQDGCIRFPRSRSNEN